MIPVFIEVKHYYYGITAMLTLSPDVGREVQDIAVEHGAHKPQLVCKGGFKGSNCSYVTCIKSPPAHIHLWL